MLHIKNEFIKKLLGLVLPMAFQFFMLSLVSASDAVMLGALSQDAMSAVSLAAQVAFVEGLFLMAMTGGLSIFAAQYWGKGDIPAVERYFGYVFRLTVVLAGLFTLAALCVPQLIMRFFTDVDVLIAGGANYLRAVSFSYLLSGVAQIYLCILKNSERAGLCSAISSTSVVVNIALNAVLIFGLFGLPRLGITGAALATVTARLIEVIWSVSAVARGRVRLRRQALFHTENSLRRDFWKYSAPVLGNQIVWGMGFTMYSVIMGHLGSDAVAANSIYMITRDLICCFCYGVAGGAGVLVGNELGAGRLDRARAYGDRLCRLTVLGGFVSGLVLFALSPLILSAVNLSQTAHYYLRWLLRMGCYNVIGCAYNSTTISGIFCAGGDSRFGFVCDTINMWLFIVPLAAAAAFVWKLPVLAVCFILSLDEMCKLPVVYRHYKKYNWVKDLTVPAAE